MVDLIVLNEDSDAQYIKQLPRKYCHQLMSSQSLYLILELDFGAPIEGEVAPKFRTRF